MTDEELEISCKECGKVFPFELIENLFKGIPVYCERCGYENKKEFFPILTETKQTISNIKYLIKKIRKKAIKYTKTKISRIRKKIEDFKEKHLFI
ncbi:MAG: hypothetical protein ACTSQJ_14190 [Promethearchaeota archaeon]